MRVPINIKTLLYADAAERERIEFKEIWDPSVSLKTICAFANDIDDLGGGWLVIGVEERGRQACQSERHTHGKNGFLSERFV